MVLKPHHHIKVNAEMKADLQVWLIFLDEPSAYCRPFMDCSVTLLAVEIDFFTDASRNFNLGFGGYCKDQYFCHNRCSFTANVKPSIKYLELYTVTIGVLKWIKKFKNSNVRMVLIRLITLEGLKQNVRSVCKTCEDQKE